MGTNFNTLDRRGKNRIIIFTVITVIAAIIYVNLVWFWYVFFKNPTTSINIDDIMNANIDVDGANFNWFLLPLAIATNVVAMIVILGIHIVIIFIMDLLTYGIFRAIAFRKINFVSETEYILAKQMLTIILIASIVISLFITHIDIYVLSLTVLPIFFMWLFGYLFYIRPLKQKRQKYI